MTGRVNGLAVSADGKRIAAVSSLDGKGQISVYGYEFNPDLPGDLRQINQKVVNTRSQGEKDKLAEFLKKDIKRYANVENVKTALFAVAFHPNSKQLAVAGADGVIRLVNPETGKTEKEFSAITLQVATQSTEPSKTEVTKVSYKSTGDIKQSHKVDFIQDVQPILSHGLQCRNLPRLGPGQKWLQIVSARLRPDFRRPRLNR